MRLEFEVKNWENPEAAQKVSGTVTLRKKKPEFCRRLSGDQFAQCDQRIWQMRADGHTVQDIADSVGCGLATVDRALKRLVARRRRLSPALDLEAELGDEVDAALAEYDDGRMRAADARSAADVMNLARGRIRGVRAGQHVGSIP